jgi:hypothetical protein
MGLNNKKNIETKTLLDLASYKNAFIRLAKFVQETDLPYIVNKMGEMGKQSDSFDIVNAFDSDLNNTVKIIQKLSVLLQSVDNKGVVAELGEENNNLNELFPDNWDQETKTLTLFGVKISTHNSFGRGENEDLKFKLYSNAISKLPTPMQTSYDIFKKYRRLINKIEKTDEPNPSSSVLEVIEAATLHAKAGELQTISQSLLQTADNYNEFRRTLNHRERNFVDEKVKGNTVAMIDGVAKSSTYITKEGIDQEFYATKHRKHPEVMSKIASLVKGLDAIRSIEMDQDTDPYKTHDTLIEIQQMGLDLADAFEFKIRKLGKYRASGMMASKDTEGKFSFSKEYGFASGELRIVAIDVEAPTSLAHEIAHFRDTSLDLYRGNMIRHFGGKINTGELSKVLSKTQVAYFMNPREIIARLGEIGYLLNKHKYKDGESLQDFSSRVQNIEKISNPDKYAYDVALTKDMKTYQGKSNPIMGQAYFNMSDWSLDDIALVRDYTHDFYYKHDPEIARKLKERIANGEVGLTTKTYQSPNTRQKYKISITDEEKLAALASKLSPDDLPKIYRVIANRGWMEDGILPEIISSVGKPLFTGKKNGHSTTYIDIGKKLNAYAELLNEVNVKLRPADAMASKNLLFDAISSNLKVDEWKSNRQNFGDISNAILYHTNIQSMITNATLKALRDNPEEKAIKEKEYTPSHSRYTPNGNILEKCNIALGLAKEKLAKDVINLETGISTVPINRLPDDIPARIQLEAMLAESMKNMPKDFLKNDERLMDVVDDHIKRLHFNDTKNSLSTNLKYLIENRHIPDITPNKLATSLLGNAENDDFFTESLLTHEVIKVGYSEAAVRNYVYIKAGVDLPISDEDPLIPLDAAAKSLSGHILGLKGNELYTKSTVLLGIGLTQQYKDENSKAILKAIKSSARKFASYESNPTFEMTNQRVLNSLVLNSQIDRMSGCSPLPVATFAKLTSLNKIILHDALVGVESDGFNSKLHYTDMFESVCANAIGNISERIAYNSGGAFATRDNIQSRVGFIYPTQETDISDTYRNKELLDGISLIEKSFSQSKEEYSGFGIMDWDGKYVETSSKELVEIRSKFDENINRFNPRVSGAFNMVLNQLAHKSVANVLFNYNRPDKVLRDLGMLHDVSTAYTVKDALEFRISNNLNNHIEHYNNLKPTLNDKHELKLNNQPNNGLSKSSPEISNSSGKEKSPEQAPQSKKKPMQLSLGF